MIFVLCGRANSGKNALADVLQSKLEILRNTNVIHGTIGKFAFADPIKEILSTSFSVPIEKIDDLKRSDSETFSIGGEHLTMRQILQRFGSDACQEIFGQTVWADLLCKRIANTDYPIITDCRFEFEVDVLDKNFGMDQVFLVKLTSDETSPHLSENDIVKKNDKFFDAVFDNTDHQLDLDAAANRIIELFARDLV